MIQGFIKRRLLDLYRHNVAPRNEALHAEQIFQGIFAQQCRRHHIEDVFYPVGAAAGYSLLYLLARILTELPVRRVVEMGSGQTTVLIDRLLPEGSSHVAYEQSEAWVGLVRPRAPRCDLRHSAIARKAFDGAAYEGYAGLQTDDFDLLLVDGPNGTDHRSRFDCVPLVDANTARDFVVVIDDAVRPGEQETVAALTALLQRRGVEHKLNYLCGRATQAVITTAGYRAASYFY